MGQDFDGYDAEDITSDDLELDWSAISAAVREFSTIDAQVKGFSKRTTELKSRLKSIVELEGEPDEKGNLLLPLPQQCGDIVTLQLQRKVSNPINSEVAEGILKEAGMWDECVEMIPVLDEAKVMAAYYEDKLTESQVDEMFPVVESFAFVPIRNKAK